MRPHINLTRRTPPQVATQRSLRQTRQREGEIEREREREGAGVLAYPGAKYAFATAYLMLFACFNYNCCVPHASYCCTLLLYTFRNLLLFFSVYLVVYFVLCSASRNPNLYFYSLASRTCRSAHFSLIRVL